MARAPCFPVCFHLSDLDSEESGRHRELQVFCSSYSHRWPLEDAPLQWHSVEEEYNARRLMKSSRFVYSRCVADAQM